MTDRMLTIEEVAEMRGQCARTVIRGIEAGRIPAYKLGPHHIRIKESDAFADLKRVTPKAAS